MAFSNPSCKSMNNLTTFVDNENCLKMTFGPSLYNYQSFNVCDLDNLMLIQFYFSFGTSFSKYPFLK